MTIQMTEAPLVLKAGAIYSDGGDLAKQYTFLDRFEEEYKLYSYEHCKAGDIMLPRNSSPVVGGDFDYRDEGEDVFFVNAFVPRNDEQRRVVAGVNALLDDDVSHICQAMTGFGKTYVGCAAAAHQGKRTIVITTKEDIIKQWAQAAKDVLGLRAEDIGYIQGNVNSSAGKPFVIALVQSARKGPDRYDHETFDGFGLAIFDEVHRMGAEGFSEACWHLNAKLRLGLSATPYRKDGRDQVFHAHIGTVQVVGTQEAQVPAVVMINTGWSMPRYPNGKPVAHSHGRTMGLVKYMADDFARNDKICRFVKAAFDKDRNIIVFSDTTAHLENLQQHLKEHYGIGVTDSGLYVGLQYYSGPKAEKERKRERVKSKRVILATYKMASEATDIPWLDTCVLGTPKADVVQIVGRIRREYEGKKSPVVADINDPCSKVLRDYMGARVKWYKSIGATIRHV